MNLWWNQKAVDEFYNLEKPAVIAETEDWVGMASEFRALSRLPNISNADVWEPSPGKIYSWGG